MPPRRSCSTIGHVLAGLLINQYKDGNTQVIAIVLGARSLSQVTNAVELRSRADTAVSSTVLQIHRLRDAIALRRTQLFRERKQVRHQKAVIDARRTEIEKMLKQRRALVKELGIEVNVIKGAATIGQAQLALAARKWITADQKLNRDDPGRLVRDQVVLEGLQQIGVPYVWGGASPAGFDCSGLVMWLWAKHGLALPHFAAAQYGLGPVVEQGPVLDETKLQIGDLLFFHKLGHVGIYVGNGLVQIELGHAVAGADTELQPTVRKDVDHRGLLGDVDRRMQRRQQHRGPDPDPRRA